LNAKIGAARTELRVTENNMEELRKEIERDAHALARRFQWVREFKMLIGEEDSFILSTGEKIPYFRNPFDIKLKRDIGTPDTWKFQGRYDEGDEDVLIFQTEEDMKSHVSLLFRQAQPEMEISDEIAWKKRWDHLCISEEALAKTAEDAKSHREKQRARAQVCLDAAFAEFEKWARDSDTESR